MKMNGMMCTCLHRFQYHGVQISNSSYYLVNRYKYFILGRSTILDNSWFWKHSQSSESTIGWAFNQERWTCRNFLFILNYIPCTWCGVRTTSLCWPRRSWTFPPIPTERPKQWHYAPHRWAWKGVLPTWRAKKILSWRPHCPLHIYSKTGNLSFIIIPTANFMFVYNLF